MLKDFQELRLSHPPKMEEEKKEENPNETPEEELEVVYKAAQLAPIVDRMGRMLTDFAPQLNQIVKNHSQRVRPSVPTATN